MEKLDGSSYKGNWKDDMFDGLGIYENANGETIFGIWSNDNLLGWGI